MKPAYYNEFDPQVAAWLRELIRRNLIVPGDVDERSIEDVHPDDLKGYTQCHFFAGIGVWSYALRRAGWPDDRPIWTGSCPCQPFSAAGKGLAFADERHLWPAFEWLIRQRRPATVLGEQVASKDVDPWVDLVQADMESMGYAFGSVPFPSAGVGAPHIRDRNYWAGVSLGDTSGKGLEGLRGRHKTAKRHGQGTIRPIATPGEFVRLADSDNIGRIGRRASQKSDGGKSAWIESERLCDASRVADMHQNGRHTGREVRSLCAEHDAQHGGTTVLLADTERNGLHRAAGDEAKSCSNRSGNGLLVGGSSELRGTDWAGPTNGYWRDVDWLSCRDGKWRPVEPGTFPLVNGAAARVVRLRGYGNAINAIAAQTWIETVMECIE